MAVPDIALPNPASAEAGVKAALPALTVMLANGAINLIEASLILIIGWTISRWVWRWAHDGLHHAHYIDETLKPLLANFASYGVLAITIVAVLGQFGVQTTSLIALLGAAGLAVGLALQGTLSNVASGVMLLVLRPFRVFEKIKVADATGTVKEIGLFRTVLTTDDGLFVSIPNATIFSGTITNISREAVRRTAFTIDIDQGEDIAAVRQLILDALAGDPNVLKDPAPDVQVDALSGASNLLSVQAWLENKDFGGRESDLRALVRKTLRDAQVSAPVPMAGIPREAPSVRTPTQP
jgi:small conductance mechanosensitive channel